MRIETSQLVNSHPGPSLAPNLAPNLGRAKVVAAFSYRYDAHLVPALLHNISPVVHGWVACDDRGAGQVLSSEVTRRGALLTAAQAMGADWILGVDPDERFEDRLGQQIGALTNDHGPVLWSFQTREMFSPTQYRTDGLWGRKSRICLFPVLPGMAVPDTALHGVWFSYPEPLPHRPSGLNFYHLRMATPVRRQARRDLYAAADPDRRYQAIGYDYLADERGMVLQDIPQGCMFSPPHHEDGGHWGPSVPLPAPPVEDPAHARLQLFVRTTGAEAPLLRAHVAGDLAAANPDDADLQLLALDAVIRAGGPCQAQIGGLLARIAALHPTPVLTPAQIPAQIPALAPLLASRFWQHHGDTGQALALAAQAVQIAPHSQLVRQQVQRCLPLQERLADPQALWRRWISGPASLQDGDQMPPAGPPPSIAVVVIGFRAPRELAAAVQSIRDQKIPTNLVIEIIVVNTGGGNPRAVLRHHLPHIRLIAVEQPLFIGAARNIGIDASDAPIVAFLASDCLAQPGWITARLARHQAGAAAVASAVVPRNCRSWSSLAASAWLHRRRWPRPTDEPRARHGFSYARHLFDDFGYFPTGPASGEDTMFNERIYDRISHVWAPEVLTAHRYPTTPLALVADMFRRARRRLPAEFAPATLRQPMTTLLAELRARLLFRQRLARLLVPDMAGLGLTPGLGSGGRLAVRQLIRAIRYAEFWGTASRLPALARAGRQLERLEALQQTRTADADRTAPGQALRITQRLRRRFPLIWQFHLAAATGLAQAATGPQAQNDTQTKNDTQAKAILAAYQQATALIPDQSAPVLALCTWLESRGQHGLSQAQAEWAAIMAPTQSLFLQRARYPALKAGHLAEALLAAQATLLRDPVRPALHRDLAQVYSMMGQPDMAQRRLQMAEALEQSGR